MPSCFIHILAGCGINLGLLGLELSEELISSISTVGGSEWCLWGTDCYNMTLKASKRISSRVDCFPLPEFEIEIHGCISAFFLGGKKKKK